MPFYNSNSSNSIFKFQLNNSSWMNLKIRKKKKRKKEISVSLTTTNTFRCCKSQREIIGQKVQGPGEGGGARILFVCEAFLVWPAELGMTLLLFYFFFFSSKLLIRFFFFYFWVLFYDLFYIMLGRWRSWLCWYCCFQIELVWTGVDAVASDLKWNLSEMMRAIPSAWMKFQCTITEWKYYFFPY